VTPKFDPILPEDFVPISAGAPRRSAPPRWNWHLLTRLARLESGHTPSRNHPEWWGGDIPWISLPDIRELDGRTTQQTRERTNQLGVANSAARVLPVGTVVMSRTASIGYVTIMARPMATSQDFVNWVCGPELVPEFLAYLFASFSVLHSVAGKRCCPQDGLLSGGRIVLGMRAESSRTRTNRFVVARAIPGCGESANRRGNAARRTRRSVARSPSPRLSRRALKESLQSLLSFERI
jgi:hypothetical protein